MKILKYISFNSIHIYISITKYNYCFHRIKHYQYHNIYLFNIFFVLLNCSYFDKFLKKEVQCKIKLGLF